MKVTLKVVRPPIWRRVLAMSSMRLDEFHSLLQVVMGWSESHLHQFVFDGKRYGEPDPEFDFELDDPMLNEKEFRIEQLLKKEKDVLVYEYDFGDGWEHKILLEKILPFNPEQPLPKCIAGRRHCPPEDVGGPWGYEDFLEIYQDSSHPEHEEMREWAGDYFEPEAFDILEVNTELGKYVV